MPANLDNESSSDTRSGIIADPDTRPKTVASTITRPGAGLTVPSKKPVLPTPQGPYDRTHRPFILPTPAYTVDHYGPRHDARPTTQYHRNLTANTFATSTSQHPQRPSTQPTRHTPPPNPSTRPTQTRHTTRPAPPVRQRHSDNYRGPLDNITKELVSTIFSLGQAIHHSDNWHSTPHSIKKLFHNITDNIHPAHDTDGMTTKLVTDLVTSCMNVVRLAMYDHYQAQTTLLTQRLDVPTLHAFDLAVTRLKRKIRISTDNIDKLRQIVFSPTRPADLTLDCSVTTPGTTLVTPLTVALPAITVTNDTVTDVTNATVPETVPSTTAPPAATVTTTAPPATTVTTPLPPRTNRNKKRRRTTTPPVTPPCMTQTPPTLTQTPPTVTQTLPTGTQTRTADAPSGTIDLIDTTQLPPTQMPPLESTPVTSPMTSPAPISPATVRSSFLTTPTIMTTPAVTATTNTANYTVPFTHKPLRNGTKCTWTLDIAPDTEYLVIGDSNLRHLSLPDNLHIQVEVYPGACFHHINDLLRKCPPSTHLKHIFLNVGVNERNNDFVNTVAKKLNTLANTISHLKTTTSFISIPYSRTVFTSSQCDCISRCNDSARKSFFHFMHLLDSSLRDNSGILSDPAVSALSARIAAFIMDSRSSDIQRYLRPTPVPKN